MHDPVTYGDLWARMNQAARGLATLGVGPGDTVAVVMSNRAELIEAYGAAVQTGLTFVAVNWHLGETEIAYILEDSGAKALIVEGQFADSARAAADQVALPESSRFSVDGSAGFRPYAELLDGHSGDALTERRAGQIMFYTSGTTGRPKGVRSGRRFPMQKVTSLRAWSTCALEQSEAISIGAQFEPSSNATRAEGQGYARAAIDYCARATFSGCGRRVPPCCEKRTSTKHAR